MAVLEALAPSKDRPHLLALSVSDAAEDVVPMISAGALGYVTTTIDTVELLRAIATVASGEASFSPRLAAFVLQAFTAPPPAAQVPDELETLTPREREVLHHLARGYSYKRICARLGISARIVESHVGAVYASCRSPRATKSATGSRRAAWWTAGTRSDAVLPLHVLAGPSEAQRQRQLVWTSALAAGRDLLDGPGVAVWVAEEDEPDVVESVGLTPGVFPHDLDLADVHPALCELRACRVKVSYDQLQALEGARRHIRDDPLAHDDRAAGSGRGELDYSVSLADLGVVIDVEAEPLGIERLGTFDVRDGNDHHFKRPVHQASPSIVRLGHQTRDPVKPSNASTSVDPIGFFGLGQRLPAFAVSRCAEAEARIESVQATPVVATGSGGLRGIVSSARELRRNRVRTPTLVAVTKPGRTAVADGLGSVEVGADRNLER